MSFFPESAAEGQTEVEILVANEIGGNYYTLYLQKMTLKQC